MRKLFAILLMVSAQNLWAQRIIDVTSGDHQVTLNGFFTVAGTPFVGDKYVKVVSGTPYFLAEWTNTILVSARGQEYKNVLVRLNLHTGEVIYKDAAGKELTATTPLKEVVFTDSINNYRFVHSSTFPVTATPVKEGWYQWLCSGSASLYKFYKKNINESRPYGSATSEQTITTAEFYYVLYNNALIELKKLKDAPSVLANRKSELEKYLKDKDDKNASSEDRFTALVGHYNILLKQESK